MPFISVNELTLNDYRSKLKHSQMHQCKSIYIGKTVISNQVKIGLKSESIATLLCDVSNQERLDTNSLKCKKQCEVIVM